MSQDVLELRAWFGVEFLDPISLEVISRDLQVSLQDNPAQPILSSSGRFAWRAESVALPSAVLIKSVSGRYASRRYPLEFAQPAVGVPLFRLSLLTAPSYPFTSEVTLVRGRLIEAAAPERVLGIGGAEINLRWFDRVQSDWQERDGPRCVSSSAGYFAAALPLPPAARPKREADQSLSVRLLIERRDLAGPPQQRSTAALTAIKESKQHTLPDIVWSQCLPG
jgi:hypothetical protein